MSIFDDLRMIEFQGEPWAVVDKVSLHGRTYLGLASKSHIERAASDLRAGSAPRFPASLTWVEEGLAGIQAAPPGFERKVQEHKESQAARAFLKARQP